MQKLLILIISLTILIGGASWFYYQFSVSHADIKTLQDFQQQQTQMLAELQTLPLAVPQSCQNTNFHIFKTICENKTTDKQELVKWSKGVSTLDKQCVEDAFHRLFQRFAQLQRQIYQPPQTSDDNQLTSFACVVHSDISLFIKDIDLEAEKINTMLAIEAWYKYKLFQ